jgi:hypothetical protein
MSTRSLIDKIEALPPEKKAEVEDFVEFLTTRAGGSESTGTLSSKTFPDDLLERIRRGRERLFEKHGDFDTLPELRDLRENGPR